MNKIEEGLLSKNSLSPIAECSKCRCALHLQDICNKQCNDKKLVSLMGIVMIIHGIQKISTKRGDMLDLLTFQIGDSSCNFFMINVWGEKKAQDVALKISVGKPIILTDLKIRVWRGKAKASMTFQSTISQPRDDLKQQINGWLQSNFPALNRTSTSSSTSLNRIMYTTLTNIESHSIFHLEAKIIDIKYRDKCGYKTAFNFREGGYAKDMIVLLQDKDGYEAEYKCDDDEKQLFENCKKNDNTEIYLKFFTCIIASIGGKIELKKMNTSSQITFCTENQKTTNNKQQQGHLFFTQDFKTIDDIINHIEKEDGTLYHVQGIIWTIDFGNNVLLNKNKNNNLTASDMVHLLDHNENLNTWCYRPFYFIICDDEESEECLKVKVSNNMITSFLGNIPAEVLAFTSTLEGTSLENKKTSLENNENFQLWLSEMPNIPEFVSNVLNSILAPTASLIDNDNDSVKNNTQKCQPRQEFSFIIEHTSDKQRISNNYKLKDLKIIPKKSQ